MKCIAGVFLLAAMGMAQALLAPDVGQPPKTTAVGAAPAYQPMTASERWQQQCDRNWSLSPLGQDGSIRGSSASSGTVGEKWRRLR